LHNRTDESAKPNATLIRNVEHSDIDGFGVVHFSRYAVFFETIVLILLEELGFGIQHIQEHQLELRIRELRIRYRSAARFGDPLRLTATLANTGIAHLDFDVNASLSSQTEAPRVIALGRLDAVVVEQKNGSPVVLAQVPRKAS
jgi:YbgC/YbaW family acyl-CoA thioester hydrolase